MNKEISAQVVEYIETTGQALALATKLASVGAEERRQVAAIAPGLAAQLKQAGVIKAHEEKRASELLQQPQRALEIFSNTLQRTQSEKTASADRLGSPAGSRSVAGDTITANTNPNYFGRRPVSGEKRASDEALLRLIPGNR